ncbi:MAG: diguanylate cyclase domain-containing protein [Lysinibacillus sp.]
MNMQSYGKLGRRLIYSSIFSAVILILFIIASTIWIRLSLNENIRGQRSLDSIDDSYNLLYKSIIDQETGQRGYNLTGDEAFLEPYHRGGEIFEENTEPLLQKTEHLPLLNVEIKQVIEKGKYWQEHYGEVLIGLGRNGVQPDKQLMEEAKATLDEFRQQSADFSVHIEGQRSIVREKMKSRINFTLIALVLITSLIICINLFLNIRNLKSIVKPIIQLDDCVTSYARHEFTKSIPVYRGSDELSALIANIDMMRSELAASIGTLESKVHYDELTGLFNRRYFNDFLWEKWSSAKQNSESVSLILFDIDHYKNFNDTYGHLAGDDCLKIVSQLLNAYNTDSTSVVARYGGEEFALLLASRTEQEVRALAEEIREAIINLKIPHRSSVTDEFVTISAGAATITPRGGRLPDELIDLADQALYHSKQTGRNRVTYYHDES